MSMRNHWVEVRSSSLKNEYATGPIGKQDDMTISLYQDNQGESEQVIRIECYPIGECTETATGKKVFRLKTVVKIA